MSKIRFVCLANSYKEGGRCIAGIILDENDTLSADNRWIRPVCNTMHGEIPVSVAQQYHPLDILEIEFGNSIVDGHQVENVQFECSSFLLKGQTKIDAIRKSFYSLPALLGSTNELVSIDQLHNIKQSICLIQVFKFDVFEELELDRPYPKAKLRFEYQQVMYSLPISDPIFIAQYKRNKQILCEAKELLLTISLGKLHDSYCRKFVACIFVL